jgi:hypothetical protein
VSSYSLACIQGPTYWCRDASTANECGKVLHCQQTVWQQQEQTKSTNHDETSQMLCNILVKASHDLLASGSIEIKSLKSLLRQDCAKLPNRKNLVQNVNSLHESVFIDDA